MCGYMRKVQMRGVIGAIRIDIKAIALSISVCDCNGAPPSHERQHSEEKANLNEQMFLLKKSASRRALPAESAVSSERLDCSVILFST
jgi:hypothetical protein